MHEKFKILFEKSPPPLQFCSEFPCDSRGGLRLAVSQKLEGLEPQNVRHTIEKKH